MRANLRVLAAAALAGGWLGLLLSGHAFGGAIHLLAVAAVAVAPWRTGGGPAPGREESR